MTQAYLRCALWSGTDEAGEPLDTRCRPDDIAAASTAAMTADCVTFAADNFTDLHGMDAAQAGQDLC